MINQNCETRGVLWVPETLRTSHDLLIFVDQSTDLVASSDVVDLGCCAVGEWS
jgi:hypothetical protein